MSKPFLVLAALMLALPASAQPTTMKTGPAATASTVTAKMSNDPVVLQRQLAAERAKVEDLKLKLRIKASTNPFSSPLDRFFDSKEFEDRVVDVRERECSKRCITSAQRQRQACTAIINEARRLKCFQDAAASAAACQRICFG